MTATEPISLELDDIQSGALHERPSPYVGTYLLLRIDDPAAGRELVGRLHGLVDTGRPPPSRPATRGSRRPSRTRASRRSECPGPRSTASRRSSGRAWPRARPSWGTSARAAPS